MTYDAFIAYLNALTAPGIDDTFQRDYWLELLKEFEEGNHFTPQQVIITTALDRIEVLKNSTVFNQKRSEVEAWVDDNVKKSWFRFNYKTWIFEDVNDAVLFKLTWG